MTLPPGVLAGMELAINRFLRLDPQTLARLQALSGRIIAIEFKGVGLTLYMAPGGGGVQMLGDYAGTPDAVIRGAPLSLARVGLDKQGRGPLFAGDVEVSGDVELGRRFEEILRHIDIDWEEQLARASGDVAAHQIGNVVRGALTWGKKAVDTLSRDLADYLQEESHTLPLREEVDAYLNAVDEVRSDVDRLEARVQRLAMVCAQREQEA